MPDISDPNMVDFHSGDKGEYISLYIQSDRVASALSEAEDGGWECVAVTPYRIEPSTGNVLEYLLVLRR